MRHGKEATKLLREKKIGSKINEHNIFSTHKSNYKNKKIGKRTHIIKIDKKQKHDVKIKKS